MIQNITSYYIPQNQNIQSGKIYTIYLNKVNNLDLSSITNKEQTKTFNRIVNSSPTQKEEYSISKEEYQAILNLLNEAAKLYNESKNLSQVLTKGKR